MKFSDLTSAIIKTVQAKLRLTADGIAGQATWSGICVALHTPSYLSLRDKICAVQRLLALDIDGIDGPETWAAIARSLNVAGDAEPLQAADKGSSAIRNFDYWQTFFISRAPQHAGDQVKQIAVRGWLEGTSKEDRFDIYDDAIIVLNGAAATIFRAAVDPTTYLVRHPINTDGAAQLMIGLWKFRRGLHHGKPSLPCFIQAEDFIVNRLDAGGHVTHQETGDFGIHIHSGGDGDTTDRFSAGCQIIHNPDGYRAPDGKWGAFWYQKFYYPQIATMQMHDQTVLPYLLVGAEDLPKIA